MSPARLKTLVRASLIAFAVATTAATAVAKVSPAELAQAVEKRAAATDFAALEAFGLEAMKRRDREGLNRLYHVAWTTLNQGDFEQAVVWNNRLAAQARTQNDARYQAIARLNALTILYDQGDLSVEDEMTDIARTTRDWFVMAHAARLSALALMDQDRIGEGLRLLTMAEAEIPVHDPYAATARAGVWEVTGMGLMKLSDMAGAADAFRRFEIDDSNPDYPRPDFDSLYNLARISVQVGDVANAELYYAAHHRLSQRAGLESLSAYDAALCAFVAEARRDPRGVLDCLAKHEALIDGKAFLALDILPVRGVARARLGDLAGARRDLERVRELAPGGAADPMERLLEAELLFGLKKPTEAFEVLREYQRERDLSLSRRFSAGIHQVTGDMQQQLTERRRQLETARANTRLQRAVIRGQNWILGISLVFVLSALLVLLWQRRQSQRLKKAQLHAEAASRAKSEFLANMSHEIRTPLNGVVAMAETLAGRDLSERDLELVNIIRSSGVTLERLLSDILDVSRIESGQVAIDPAPFDLEAAVRDVSGLWAPLVMDKGLELRLELDPDLPRRVVGDAVRLRQVLTNLVSNALKFTQEGAVTLSVVRHEADQVRFAVADTGIGFDAGFKARIFHRFQQEDGSITRRFGGSGLGLAISDDLVRLMGGELDCESPPGGGARFWFDLHLPAAQGDDDEAEAHAPAAPVVRADRGEAPRVLLADDHPVNRKVVELMLEPLGVELTVVEDGAQALAAFMDGGFDLVLMDMQMPVMDGLTATMEIRAHEQRTGAARTPILMLTANAMSEHVEAGRRAGADGHLTKPLSVAALTQAVAGALDRTGDQAAG
ncbi:hybrid sensor histidine kinase/response regulator [Brevundimonas diminuta]|uniref:hybrid sensor histidine kinase/response regulator n=1 Tax=Brevundimonas diminuta TaxID=293 RepID=UPI00320AABA4